MNFDVPLLLVGFVFSGVGFVFFSYGKKMQNFKVTFTGLALMVYPYFIDKMSMVVVVGLVLSALPFVLKWW